MADEPIVNTADTSPAFTEMNPGGYDSAAKGCTCDPVKNNHGKGSHLPSEWVVDQGCKVHSTKSKTKAKKSDD